MTIFLQKTVKPGLVPIAPEQITRRWKIHVKSKLVIKDRKVTEKSKLEKNDTEYQPITADFYALKHLFLDKVDEAN
jgi:hypothetical protein